MNHLPRVMQMIRDLDVSGVSGTGHVAEVAVFSDGHCAVHWFGEFPTTTPHVSMHSVKSIHGHNGGTRFVPVDKDLEIMKLQSEVSALRSLVEDWRALISDLDRCKHGRHQIDSCVYCPVGNDGNPHLREGDVIGHTLYGRKITVPPRSEMFDPKAWRPKRDD